jgi:D-alanyl-D-alanine carboxypeptidase
MVNRYFMVRLSLSSAPGGAVHPRGRSRHTDLDTVARKILPDLRRRRPVGRFTARRAPRGVRALPNDVTTLNPSWGWAAGATISTAADLADYVEALVGGGLLGDDLQADRLASVTSTDPGSPDAAGYGWALASFGPYVGHDGSLPGYQSFMGHDPDTDTTLIVLTNLQSGPTGTQTANEIARAVMGEL